MQPRLQIKRSNNRYSDVAKDYVLKDGELLFDKASKFLFIGDGKHKLQELQPINKVNPMVYKATSLSVVKNSNKYVYKIGIPITIDDAKSFDFELYVDVGNNQAWEIGPNGSSIILNGADGASLTLDLYAIGKSDENGNRVIAPSGSFGSNTVIRLYITMKPNFEGAYIYPAVAMWA